MCGFALIFLELCSADIILFQSGTKFICLSKAEASGFPQVTKAVSSSDSGMCSKQESGRMAAWFKWKTWKSLEAWVSCLNFLLSPANIYIFFLTAAFIPNSNSGAQQSPWWPERKLYSPIPAPSCAGEHLGHSSRVTASLLLGKLLLPSQLFMAQYPGTELASPEEAKPCGTV